MRVLFVSYYFPPMGGAGVQRALKFVKYLPQFGVEPVVLAAHDPAYAQDPSLLADIPGSVRVVRVPYTPLLQRVLAWRRSEARPAAASVAPRTGAASAAEGAGTAAPALGSARLRDTLLAAWSSLRFPDDRAGWVRRAWAPGRVLLRDGGFDLVLSTAPPMSAHALASRLAAGAGLPWVADFRDLWTGNPGYAAPGWRRALDARTERRWLRRAAGVVTVTPSWRERLASEAGGGAVPSQRVAFIPNGYDEADFAALPPGPPPPADGALRLVHTGSFYGPRDPAPLLDAMARVLRDPPPGARALRLRLVGQVGSRFAAGLAAFDAAWPGAVERVPYLPHDQALAEMAAADALLLVIGAGETGRRHTDRAVVAGTLPGKIFEYLRAGRPVLLLGDPQGDAARLLREHGHGWIAEETEPRQIAEALRAMLAGPPPPAAPGADVARFERRALAGELAAFLRGCRA